MPNIFTIQDIFIIVSHISSSELINHFFLHSIHFIGYFIIRCQQYNI